MTSLIQLSLENFFAVEKETVDFTHDGVSLIIGENGSSKTTMFIEGPYYALFGQSFEYGDKPGDAVRSKWATSMVVQLIFDTNGQRYRVSRYRGHKTFKNKVVLEHFIDSKWKDVSGSSATHTQSVINGLVGVSPQVFAYTGIFSDGIAKFPDLPDLEKKRIISEILGLEKCDKALKASKAKFQSLEEKRNLEKAVLVSDKKNLEDQKANLSNVEKSYNDWENGKGSRVEALLKEKESIKADLDKIASPKQSIGIVKEITSLQAEVAKLQKQLSELKQPVLKSNAVESEINTLKRSIAALSKDKKCNSCGRAFDNSADIDAHIDKETQKLQKAIQKLELTKIIDDDESANYAAERSKINGKIKELNTLLIEKNKAKAAIDTENKLLEGSHSRLTSRLAQIESKLTDEAVNPFEKLLQQARKTFNLVNSGIEQKEQRIKELDGEIEVEKNMVRLFGPKGCRVNLIETITPNINAGLKRMADIMDVPFDISLGINTEDDGIAGNIRISVSNAKGADGYHGNSRGERRVMDVMILLALASTLQSRSMFAQVFFDETLESLHETYQSAVLTCIKTMFADRSIYIISHHHAGLEDIDGIIKVQNGKII